MTVVRRKLIEVALPLEAINRESAREKSIRQGHPSTLHLWWARRPLAACRAVLFAQLVDDPSSNPDRFPTPEEQALERQRLFEIIERLVVWENIHDETLLLQAHQEILASNGGRAPAILDPFAGGGSIPLEAQRLGLEARASDLNPVPVLINRALIELPGRWRSKAPVFPGLAADRLGDWSGAAGLAEDVAAYGAALHQQAAQSLRGSYPQVSLRDGTRATVIAWLWARTVECPNPACGIELPLVSTWSVSTKKGREAWVEPVLTGRHIDYRLREGRGMPPRPTKLGRGAKFRCIACGDVTTVDYIRTKGRAGEIGQRLLCIVAKAPGKRVYVEATPEHEAAANIPAIPDPPEGNMPENPRWFSPPGYGLTTYASLFTARQLKTLTTLADLVPAIGARVASDAVSLGWSSTDAQEYGSAISLYLGLAVSRTADMNNSLNRWSEGRDQVVNLFGRQAIPMVWSFAETNPFSGASGDLNTALASTKKVLMGLPADAVGSALQRDASREPLAMGSVVSTDPPYYDNIGYADLSDFFYIWLRRALQSTYPESFATMLTPKEAELIATPYRHGGDQAKADNHFESGFERTFAEVARIQDPDFPVSIYYAFKQSEDSDDGTSSTGWETMLSGVVRAGLTVTATWPMRTEREARVLGHGTNALASSIVLACRVQSDQAEAVSRRAFMSALRDELPGALRNLQQGSIAPVDLAQAAIGPGMAVFTRFRRVLEADGSDMAVRTALALINQVLDEVLAEQEGDFDAETRFCIKWFAQFGWNETTAGEADVLSRAVNTSVTALERREYSGPLPGERDCWSPRRCPQAGTPRKTRRSVSGKLLLASLMHYKKTVPSARANGFSPQPLASIWTRSKNCPTSSTPSARGKGGPMLRCCSTD